jgi:hypothetical protein
MLFPVPPKDRLLKRRGFPRYIRSEEEFDTAIENGALSSLSPPAPFIHRDTPLVTIGSCFAGNIATALAAAGYSVVPLQVRERLFNAFALRDFMAGMCANSDLTAFVDQWELPIGQIADVRQALQKGAVVVITLGLSFVWFDKRTGEMIHDPTRRESGRLVVDDVEQLEMRATSVNDNFDAIISTIDAIRSLNPFTKLVLTLSPVPLQRAVCDYPVLAADAISKATLRCALHEVTAVALRDVYYFPSFEILRGLATMMAPIWGGDDMLSHVRHEWVDYTMSKFRQKYCVETVSQQSGIKLWTSP